MFFILTSDVSIKTLFALKKKSVVFVIISVFISATATFFYLLLNISIRFLFIIICEIAAWINIMIACFCKFFWWLLSVLNAESAALLDSKVMTFENQTAVCFSKTDIFCFFSVWLISSVLKSCCFEFWLWLKFKFIQSLMLSLLHVCSTSLISNASVSLSISFHLTLRLQFLSKISHILLIKYVMCFSVNWSRNLQMLFHLI